VLERIRGWREQVPDLTLRSTFIVGFPGETEAEFEALLDFLREAQLDRVGAFAYSPVAGAAANALADPVPEAEKAVRLEAFMALQAQISARKLQARIGQRQTVLVDGQAEDGTLIARSRGDAPEIDGVVYVEDAEALPGAFLEVEIIDALEHDLVARPI
jgi:ribosomal protein S12 methylthiotransferase